MGFALASLTKRPVLESCLTYGRDDSQKDAFQKKAFQLERSGVWGTIAKWDIESKEDCYKAYFVFLVKKLFDFLDWIGVGQYAFGSKGFKGELNRCIITYQSGFERNARSREKIIDALGGRPKCKEIRTISYNAFHAADFDFSKCNFDRVDLHLLVLLRGIQIYLKLGEQAFHSEEEILQGEDMAGRKLLALRVINKEDGSTHIATAHQLFRETCINDKYADGRHWILNFSDFDCDSYNIGLSEDSTDKVAKFIEDVIKGKHEKFSIARKR